jgi:hypothetical protein
MKNYLFFLIILILTFHSANAQNKYQDDTVDILPLDLYPYPNVLEYLNYPDTILYCSYPLRRYIEKDAPTEISLFVFRKNNGWWATTLISHTAGKRKYWELTKPMWIQTDITSAMETAIVEVDSINYHYDISSIGYTWIYIRYGKVFEKSLIGNIRDFANVAPKFTFIFMNCVLESYNNKIIKTYRMNSVSESYNNKILKSYENKIKESYNNKIIKTYR